MPRAKNIPRHDRAQLTPVKAEQVPAPIADAVLDPNTFKIITEQVTKHEKAVTNHGQRIDNVERRVDDLSTNYMHEDVVQPLLDGIEARFQGVVKNRCEALPLSDDVLDRLATVEGAAAPLPNFVSQLQEVDQKIESVGMDVSTLKQEFELIKKTQELFAEALKEIRVTLGKVTVTVEAA